MTTIDWDALLGVAIDAMTHAYCPYSHFPVGAAGLSADGRIVSGCNVENAGYGVTLCAECGMVSDLIRTGGGTLVAVVAVNGDRVPVAPCGRCRQLIYEHGGPACQVLMPGGVADMTQVLPGAFGPHDLEEAASRLAPRPDIASDPAQASSPATLARATQRRAPTTDAARRSWRAGARAT